MKRNLVCFAFFPVWVSDCPDNPIWLRLYIREQELQTLPVFESAGWPDLGGYVEKDLWVTVNKKLFTI